MASATGIASSATLWRAQNDDKRSTCNLLPPVIVFALAGVLDARALSCTRHSEHASELFQGPNSIPGTKFHSESDSGSGSRQNPSRMGQSGSDS